MHASFDQQSTFASRRLLGVAGLLVFLGAFFVTPLCAALALCTMPCCEHEDGSSAGSLVSADMAACKTECSIRADEASSTVLPSVVPEPGAYRSAPVATAVAVVADPSAIAATVDRHAAWSARGADAPLHILNSTFRI